MAKYDQLAARLTITLEIGHMWTPKHSHILASAHIIYEIPFQPRGSTTDAYSSTIHMSDSTQDSTPAHVPAAPKSMVYHPPSDATLDTSHMVLPWQSCSQASKYSITPKILVR